MRRLNCLEVALGIIRFTMISIVVLGLSVSAHAALIDRGVVDGVRLIYDSTQNITWLGDANWAKTSGFDADGMMNWADANAWAAGLTIGGFTDWRLPATFDNTCTSFGCTNSEMGHLNNVDGVSVTTLGPFTNVQNWYYWSGTENPPDAWSYRILPGTGVQVGNNFKSNPFFAWAVRDGDVAPELSCSGFDSPMDAGAVSVKKNRVLPLKAQLFGSYYPITDYDILAPPIIQIIFGSGTPDADDVTDEALFAGQGTDGNQFEFDPDMGTWRFNLKTKNYTAPGIYTLTIESGDPSEYAISPTCTAEFVIY